MARARVVAPLAGSIVAIAVAPGQHVAAGEVVAIVESMKMEHEVRAAADAVVEAVRCAVGDVVADGDELAVLAVVARTAVEAQGADTAPRIGAIRTDLAELRSREALLADASRPDAIAKRHALGLRSARENIADLCDASSFVEYGGL